MNNRLAAVLAIAFLSPASATLAQTGGSWVRGPGTYSFKVCATSIPVDVGQADLSAARRDRERLGANGGPDGRALESSSAQNASIEAAKAGRGRGGPPGKGASAAAVAGCDITGVAARKLNLTMEAWGGGGGGGAGTPGTTKNHNLKSPGGHGGGGGGGGGYGKGVIAITVPLTGATTYFVKVGVGGAPGIPSSTAALRYGNAGGSSEIRFTSASGPLIAQGAGGGGGHYTGSAGWVGGAAGTGSPDGWGGTNGTAGGTPGQCTGGAQGFGGAGGGPGRTGPGYVNDGGDGGHGGYTHTLFCTGTVNSGFTAAVPGGNGQVKISW